MTKEKEFIQKIAQLDEYTGLSAEQLQPLILEARKLQGKSGLHPDAIEVLNFLNQVAGKRYSARKTNLQHISARLHEGFTIQQLKQIVEIKTYQWKKEITMSSHLNPETLFRPSKIEKYLQEVEEVLKNPQKFKQHVERNHQEEQKQSARHFDPLAS